MDILPYFYVYALARPDGSPFYIGKGSGHRIYDHEADAQSGHKCHKCNIIRKIWRDGEKVQRYIALITENEDEAYAYEAELIEYYGRDSLANGTDGGIGGSGRIVPENEREVHRRNSIRYSSDPVVRAKIRADRLRNWADPTYRANQSDKARARWADPEMRDKMLSAMLPAQRSEQSRAKKSAVQVRKWADPNAREQQGSNWKERWADPEYRARRTFERNCAECGGSFNAITVTAKFCSGKCKHRFYRKAKS